MTKNVAIMLGKRKKMTKNISDFDNYIDACKYILDKKGKAWGEDTRSQFLELYRYYEKVNNEAVMFTRTAEQAVIKWEEENVELQNKSNQ